jgi:uncharacterized membrane protein YphA (DoxX/SURF4 family)
MSDVQERPSGAGFRQFFRGVDPNTLPLFPDAIFMTIVTLALVVGLPAAIAGIFFLISNLGATWGGGH